MKVQMLIAMSGPRHDGTLWPGPGVTFDVPDWEGEQLIDNGWAAVPADPPKRKNGAKEPAVVAPAQPGRPAPLVKPPSLKELLGE